MSITYKSDIINAVPTPNKLVGFFGVYDIDDNMVNAWGTRKQAEEWIDAWVTEGFDLSHWAVRKIT